MEIFGIVILKKSVVVAQKVDAYNLGKDDGLRHGDKVMAQLLKENRTLRTKLYGGTRT